ncbi:MAG: hypothetical protein NC191_04620 [Muribaculaceae bacterium]|nr:hypothetical protein [Muribaculaceae bacterium]
MIKLSPPIITNLAQGDCRKICSFTTKSDIFGELNTTTRIYNDGHNRLISEIRTAFGIKRRLGHEIFKVDNEARSMFGSYIDVEPEYRKRNFRFGEILRLSSLITMIENGIKKFDIFSKDSAVYFHSKYCFRPQIVGFDDRNKILHSIVQNTAGQKEFEEIFAQASGITAKIQTNPPADVQRELVKETSRLTAEYIQKVQALGAQKYHPFESGMDMVLTEDSLVENRTFLNNLFHKHGIDYNI